MSKSNVTEEKKAVDALNDLLKDYPKGTVDDAQSYIDELELEIKLLISEESKTLKNRALTRVRQIKEDIKNGKFEKPTYPPELKDKPLEQKIEYLNDKDAPECLNCKIDLKLVKSGKQWRCPKCNATHWLTTHQKEFLQV